MRDTDLPHTDTKDYGTDAYADEQAEEAEYGDEYGGELEQLDRLDDEPE